MAGNICFLFVAVGLIEISNIFNITKHQFHSITLYNNTQATPKTYPEVPPDGLIHTFQDKNNFLTLFFKLTKTLLGI